MDRIVTLLAGAGVGALACALLWAGRGPLWRRLRMWRRSEQVLVEDALKHLYDCEYQGRSATLESLAGALGISGNRSAQLYTALEKRGLLHSGEPGPRLTAEGRREALRVMRSHRLWERYLADRTGLAETAWHGEADRREHGMRSAEVEALSRDLGSPRYDPHGDAIPTAAGEIAPARGQPLTALKVGQSAMIVHVEDEPGEVYARLATAGLVPGMRVRLVETSPEKVRFEADGEARSLAPVVAANLTVVPLTEEQAPEGPSERLSALEPGQQGTVVRISRACRGVQLRRLLDLGFVPGTVVTAELRGPGRDPTAYRVRGALIALRKEQADLISIRRPREATSGA